MVYQDLERDADIGTQYAKRVAGPSSAMHSQNVATFDLPLMLTPVEAKGIALRQLHSAWVNEDSPYDVGMFIPGTQGNGALMAQVVLTRALSFADDFAGARA